MGHSKEEMRPGQLLLLQPSDFSLKPPEEASNLRRRTRRPWR